MLAGAAVDRRRRRSCRTPTGRASPPAPGWRRRCRRCARRTAPASIPGPALHGTLRPYQRAGVQWLHLLSGLGLGACLADDMGLGKTIQVLSLLLVQKRQRRRRAQPSLLVAPASLLANWAAEIERFAPGPERARSCIPRRCRRRR